MRTKAGRTGRRSCTLFACSRCATSGTCSWAQASPRRGLAKRARVRLTKKVYGRGREGRTAIFSEVTHVRDFHPSPRASRTNEFISKPPARSRATLVPLIALARRFLLVEPHERERVAAFLRRGVQDVFRHFRAVFFEDDSGPVGERS